MFYFRITFCFSKRQISCEHCNTVHELSSCANLTFEDFKELESVIVDGINIGILSMFNTHNLEKYLGRLELAIIHYLSFMPYFIMSQVDKGG
jgi:hypothetical protein